MGRPRGPVPKASADRRRSTSDGKVEVAPAGGGDVVAPRLRADLHPLAVRWYESLSESGQSRFYEPSDWAAAQIVAEAIDQYGRRPTGTLLQSILAGFQVLLVTEGDRRRMRLELVRAATQGSGGVKAPTRRLRAVDGLAGG